MWHSRGTGRTDGRKLKSPCWPMPSQSARSLALERAVERPTIRRPRSVCEEMKLVLETITSSTGPLSSPSRWISSMTIRATSCTKFLVCQERDTPSHFSGVVTMTLLAAMARPSGAESPVSSTTLLPSFTSNLLRQSPILSLTSAFMGAM